ncbi:hypothetical protein MsedE_0927 [Metallosphaera sedula]|uniref:Uncharacterized protein n=2 Tax=Sulfolobaceae TaxID=118883 RepID=A0A0K1T7D6_9CREN|nr:hypothetical protein MsedE_0927 [Metallosphaera sedula]
MDPTRKSALPCSYRARTSVRTAMPWGTSLALPSEHYLGLYDQDPKELVKEAMLSGSSILAEEIALRVATIFQD